LPEGTQFVWARHDPARPALPDGRVLAATEGWAFPCDDAFGSIEQMLGRLVLTAPDLRDYRRLLEVRADHLEALGIAYLVAIAPSKAAIHPERLPSSSPRLEAPRLASQLLEVLDASNVAAVDLESALRREALGGEQLFHLRDRRWNHAGALVAARAILEAATRVCAGLEPTLAQADIVWRQARHDGDLAGRPGVALRDGRLQPSVFPGSDEQVSRPDDIALGLSRTLADGTLVVECSIRAAAPRALVLHDSSGPWLAPFLGAAFSRSIWRERASLDESWLEQERPVVVIEVIDEWRLPRLPYPAR
jgi:hypothetical protein